MKKAEALSEVATVCLNAIRYFIPRLEPDDMVQLLDYLESIDELVEGIDE